MKPKISVIITTHNGRKDRLKKAIDSVISQTFKDWELIVVDDHSMDGTYAMIETEYLEKYPITYIYRDSNFGNDTKPKNEGTLASKGDYIAYLDSDNDYWNEHLQILYKEAQNHPEIDVFYGDRMVISDDEPMEPTVGVASDFDQALLFGRNYIDTSDVLIKREALFEVGGWDERYRKYVDWNLWIRMTKAQLKFLHIPKIITNYHLHKDMKSLTVKDEVGNSPLLTNPKEPVFKPQWDPFELEIKLPYLGEITPPKVAVFSLFMGRKEYQKVMMKSLERSGYPLDHFIVAQSPEDAEFVKQYAKENNIPLEEVDGK